MLGIVKPLVNDRDTAVLSLDGKDHSTIDCATQVFSTNPIAEIPRDNHRTDRHGEFTGDRWRRDR